MTSAPNSPRSVAQTGAARNVARSSTLTPARAGRGSLTAASYRLTPSRRPDRPARRPAGRARRARRGGRAAVERARRRRLRLDRRLSVGCPRGRSGAAALVARHVLRDGLRLDLAEGDARVVPVAPDDRPLGHDRLQEIAPLEPHPDRA